ncbi:hypothetical protein RclHR1_14590011 [Rhizophagus clarus]|uniref:Uncharacterized protein n=1 Tax=Rhizophagus clarus TaxID=94130 RepID=A0A2Z6QQD3_9GLOM|nr:hypothetical protein RclHR1_14590011 [Rhizophagus clarus]
MHANTDEDAPITYDAYVKLLDIEKYFTVENKAAYIEILTRDYRGFMGTEINKEDNEIIVKNSSYKGMLHMKSGLKPLKNNPDTITVFITVKDLDKCKKLKNIWSIEIDRILYRFALAHATENDFASRKKYSREFVSFNSQTTLAAVQEAYTAQNPQHTYRQSDDKFIIEFSTEYDFFNACAITVYFNNYGITGSSCNYNINWSARNQKLAKIPSIQPPPPVKLVSITHQEDNYHIEIRQEEHFKASHNPKKHKLKNTKHPISKFTNPRQRTLSISYATGANAIILDKCTKGTTSTNTPMNASSVSYNNSSFSNSSTQHHDGIVEGLESCANSIPSPTHLTFWEPCHVGNGTIRLSLDHNINFINLKLDSPEWLNHLKLIAQKQRKVEQKAYNSYQTDKITAAVEARFAIIKSDQTRWISSSLDRHRSNVTIDRLMVTTENRLQELLLHLDEVKQAATNVYAS